MDNSFLVTDNDIDVLKTQLAAKRKQLEYEMLKKRLSEGFSSGGIASLTTTIPPKRGPNSQGLASLKKYGKQY